MSAQIGTFTFLTLKGGLIPGTGLAMEEITRPNVDGVAYRKIGKRGEQFQMTSTVDLLNAATTKTEILNNLALEGALITLIEENGSTWTNVLVLDVRHLRTDPIRQSVGGITANALFIVSMVWTLQMTEAI